MIRLLRCLTFAVCFFTVCPILAGEPRIITATGTATIRFKPDAVRIQCGIRTTELSSDAAREGTQKSTKTLLESLEALKMKNLKVTIPTLNVVQAPDSSRIRGGMGGGKIIVEPRPFTATQPVTLQLTEADGDKLKEAIEKISKLLIEHGANTNGDNIEDSPFFSSRYAPGDAPLITLLRSDDSEYREEALTLAVKKALRTARALAKGADAQIKEIISISEAEPNPELSSRAVIGNRVISGELEVTVRVTVKCSY